MVMGGGGEQVVRELLQALAAVLMEVLDRGAEALGIKADIVARQQQSRTVKRGVFHGLGGGG
ncbi:hypothetical protein D3C80_2097180 [compost metagenome]